MLGDWGWDMFIAVVIVPAIGPIVGIVSLVLAIHAIFSAFSKLPRGAEQPGPHGWLRASSVLLTLWVTLCLVLAYLSYCSLFIDCSKSALEARWVLRRLNSVIESIVLVLVLGLQIKLIGLSLEGNHASRGLIFALAAIVPLGLCRVVVRVLDSRPDAEDREAAAIAVFFIASAMQAIYLVVAAISFYTALKNLRREGPLGSLRTVATLSLLRHSFWILQPVFFPFEYDLPSIPFNVTINSLTATVCLRIMINVAAEHFAPQLDEPSSEDEVRRPLLSGSQEPQEGTDGTFEDEE
ncbi:unnamed protein product [Clonostachys rosea]|uniref:Uncharacterized protein n=1 Tax=Bionectria ochroleuca TaxID=29856 RepID=A0ABY6U6I0_BIOOC|nr:unnamed protein product [Clonostachys rosea]